MIILLFHVFCPSGTEKTMEIDTPQATAMGEGGWTPAPSLESFPPPLVLTNTEPPPFLLPILQKTAANAQPKASLLRSSLIHQRQSTSNKKADQLSL